MRDQREQASGGVNLYELCRTESDGEYLRRAVENGSECAAMALGDMALTDTDVPFWKVEAGMGIDETVRPRHGAQFAWYLLAAEGGCEEAMERVAAAYQCGYPVERDCERSLLWASRRNGGEIPEAALHVTGR